MAPESVPPSHGTTSSAPSSSSSDSDSGCALEDYLDLETHSSTVMLSLSNNDARKLKFIHTLLKLLPPQDCDERFCTALGEQERKELRRFSAHRRLHCMRRGIIVPVTSETPERCCVRCSGRILVGDTAVHAEKMQDEGYCWHIGCFVCDTCHLPLLQFIYFPQDGRIYCGRHHAELTRARCVACDQLILSERCIVAEGHQWHVEHFRCWECDAVIGGSRYVMKGGRPFCGGCFMHLHAESCEACGDPIDPDGDPVTFRGQYWHSLPSCFCCSTCRVPLQISQFTVYDGNLFCSHCSSCSFQCRHSHPSSMDAMGIPVRKPSPGCNVRHRSSRIHLSHEDGVINPGRRANRHVNLSLQHPSSAIYCPPVSSQPCMSSGSTIVQFNGHNGIVEDDDDTSCSSSDSEPEGFFLGSPIPNYCGPRAHPSPVCEKNSPLKQRQRGKNCKVS
ncbi:prickle 4 [Pelobates cultripes]|uniref:Prickle 4 n=2 Tax=Pelobates cultripes TaxID=61616 RepID=A0AAD1R196_PELCU|nr:prickle 4 [Pelobates cultripes]